MSIFLRALVRSKEKSCNGKICFPREDSAERNAAAMTAKKNNPIEVFEHYKCNYCTGWHMGHRTNFDWIPASHFNHSIMLNQYACCGSCSPDESPWLLFRWITSTVFSNRILTHFPGVTDEREQGVICPKCKGTENTWIERRWIALDTIDPNSEESVESIWNRLDPAKLL